MAADIFGIRHKAHVMRQMIMLGCVAVSALVCFVAATEPRETTSTPHLIMIDATAGVSQSWWTVSGGTPSIWASDPESSDAYRTSERRILQLTPGQYKFISFTFDFPFEITQEGTVAFSSSLDQCVGGRGTNTLIVRCKRTYPYGGEPEYSLTP